MWFLAGYYWFYLLAALVFGMFMGWRSFTGHSDRLWQELMPWTIGMILGGAIAFFKLLPTGPGFWFDLFMLLSTMYLGGCLFGYLLRLFGSDADGAMPMLVMAGPLGSMAGGNMAKAMPEKAPMPVARMADIPPASAPAPALSAAMPMPEPAPIRAKPADLAVEPAAMVAAEAMAPAHEEAVVGLSAPRGRKKDALTQIYGIDPETEAKLNALGIYHFDQIAALRPGQRRWIFARLGYSGRFPSWWWRWRHDAERILAADTSGGATPKSEPMADSQPMAAMAMPVMAMEGTKAVDTQQHAGAKPVGLAAARGGKADDLKRIRGIGKQNEGRLHALGIWHFDQIAAWNADEALWVGSYLAFPGRIEREDWIGQAKILAEGGVTDFAKRVDRGEVATSRDDTGDDGQSNIAPLPKGKKKP